MQTESRLESLYNLLCTFYSPEGQLKSALLHFAISSLCLCTAIRKGKVQDTGQDLRCTCPYSSKPVRRANHPVKWWDVQSYVMGHMRHGHLTNVSPTGINLLPRVSLDGRWQLGHGGSVNQWVISTQCLWLVWNASEWRLSHWLTLGWRSVQIRIQVDRWGNVGNLPMVSLPCGQISGLVLLFPTEIYQG